MTEIEIKTVFHVERDGNSITATVEKIECGYQFAMESKRPKHGWYDTSPYVMQNEREAIVAGFPFLYHIVKNHPLVTEADAWFDSVRVLKLPLYN